MSTSSIPRLKAALQTALAASSDLSGVQISYGAPLPMGREVITLGDATPSDQEPVFLGRNTRNEAYSLEVFVRVARTGNQQQAVTERAFVIAGVVESILRADPTVTSTVREAKVGRMGLMEFVSEDAAERTAVIDMTVEVTNRI